jgi:hypothetical protein
VSRAAWREGAAAAAAVGAAVVGWEVLLDGGRAARASGASAFLAAALADAVLAAAVALVAWRGARALRPRDPTGAGAGAALREAAVAAILFAVALVPAVLAREAWRALGAPALPVGGDVDALAPGAAGAGWVCSTVLASPVTPSAWGRIAAAARTALLLQVPAWPAFALASLLARRLAPRGPAGALRSPWPARVALVAGALSAGAAVALAPPLLAARPTAALAGCAPGAPVRRFAVSAQHAALPLDGRGARDDGAYRFALEGDERGGGDAPQPLVLRAAPGECVEVRFTNRLADGRAAFHVDGLPWTAWRGGSAVVDPAAGAEPGEAVLYRITIADAVQVERAWRIHDVDRAQDRAARGLFGALVIEPRGAAVLDPDTGAPLAGSRWDALVAPPGAPAYREFVLFHHALGPPGARAPALNYRAEPLARRFAEGGRHDALAHSSYTYGEPVTPLLRAYVGDPTRLRIVHGGGTEGHVHHLRGGSLRWEHRTKVGPPVVAFGLQARPPEGHQPWLRSDAESLDRGVSREAQVDCGAGGCLGAAGDLLLSCRTEGHAEAGEWALWRVFDTLQPRLAPLPGRAPPPAPVTSLGLVGRSVDGKALVPAARLRDPARERALEEHVEAQLPPGGVPLDALDAAVWDWRREDRPEGPLYLGEPDAAPGARPPVAAAGARPPILFHPETGRYAWPLLRPHPGRRPPFPGGARDGAPALGAWATAERPRGVCPTSELVGGSDRRLRVYAVAPGAGLLAGGALAPQPGLYADRRGRAPGATLLPVHALDCLDVLYADDRDPAEVGTSPRPDLHTHFVKGDPQASEGLAAGLAFSQHVIPYAASERRLARPAARGDAEVEVTHARRLRPGVFVAVGLGEGACLASDASALPRGAPPAAAERCTELRRVVAVEGTRLRLDAPLRHPHAAGAFLDVEFARFLWYAAPEYGLPLLRDGRTGAGPATPRAAPR